MNDMRRPARDGGFVLVGVMVLSIALVILTTAMVFWIQQEARVGVKQKKSATAFHLAEAAVDRARWKLSESDAVWKDSGKGIHPVNYRFDKAFPDISGGTYAISITSHPTLKDRRVVIGVGRDDSTKKEVRRIYAEFERETLNAAIISGGDVDIDGNSTEVNWGPIKAQNEIDYSTKRFPRLYARDEITPEPPYCSSTGCAAKTDNVQYWAFYDVPPRPIIDFEDLKSSAQATGLYFSCDQKFNNAYPASGTMTCNPNPPCSNLSLTCAQLKDKLDDNLVWYFEKDFELTGGKYLYGTVTVMEEFKLSGNGQGEYTTKPPENSYLEYKVIDTSAASEWYGDAGGGPPSASTGTFEFKTSGPTPAKRDGVKQGVSFRGFVYAKEEFDATGDNVVHGLIVIEHDEVENSGNVLVFYDDKAAENVKVTAGKLAVKVWREEPGAWPSGL